MTDDCGCGDDCTCGCDDDRGEGSGLDRGYIVVGTLGFLIMGIMLMTSGLCYLDTVADLGIDQCNLSIIGLILGLTVAMIGGYGLKEGFVAESSVMLLIAAIYLYYSLMGIGGYSGKSILDLIIAVCLLFPMTVFFMKREILAGVATLMLTIGSGLYMFFAGDTGTLVFAIPYIIAATIFIYISFGNMIYAETGEDRMPLI